jgi:hypothetical protein
MNLKQLDQLNDEQLLQLAKIASDLPENIQLILEEEFEKRNLSLEQLVPVENQAIQIDFKKEMPFLTAFQMKKHFYKIAEFEATKKFGNLNTYKLRFYLGLFCYLSLLLAAYIIRLRWLK